MSLHSFTCLTAMPQDHCAMIKKTKKVYPFYTVRRNRFRLQNVIGIIVNQKFAENYRIDLQ
jgi:hypothetical protein